MFILKNCLGISIFLILIQYFFKLESLMSLEITRSKKEFFILNKQLHEHSDIIHSRVLTTRLPYQLNQSKPHRTQLKALNYD
jgi:hypothetical protein